MKTRLTQTQVNSIKSPDKPYWILFFGKETVGLPLSMRGQYHNSCLRVPASDKEHKPQHRPRIHGAL